MTKTTTVNFYTIDDIVYGNVKFDLAPGYDLDVDVMDEADGTATYVAWVYDSEGEVADSCSSKDKGEMLTKVLALAEKYKNKFVA